MAFSTTRNWVRLDGATISGTVLCGVGATLDEFNTIIFGAGKFRVSFDGTSILFEEYTNGSYTVVWQIPEV